MNNWIYVHDINPILFSLGPLRIGWYGLMYAITFLTGYWYLQRTAKKEGGPIPVDEVPNLATYIILGTILGGRLGWVIFYGGMPYLMEPWRVIETWKGGMSFHGGMLGVAAALLIYARRHKLSPLKLADYIMLWLPVGLFLGRIGNFINGELFGKPTDGTWGVIFPHADNLPRHPSQLYEAGMEGVLLFIILLVLKSRKPGDGYAPATVLLAYGVFRFIVEFVRLPDADIGYLWAFFTMGQLLSLPMIAAGIFWWWLILKKSSKSG